MLEAAVVKRAVEVVNAPRSGGNASERLQVYSIDGCYYVEVPVVYLPGREDFFHVADFKSRGYVAPSVTVEEAAARQTEHFYCRLSVYTVSQKLNLPLSKQQDAAADVIPEGELTEHK